ncbi:protein kinase [Rhodococcus sp. D2-41]|uniref:protein kinase domain-containing protein n=1 Tax=Speluncibacter jeojiensis TaxID=2710754 RepID=UPI00240FEF4C|nr:protein kinase [Rhodococcus sp. D2-41]MDG3012899.1 protein kinase [Rhodococcus sp. D2-41]
MTDNDRLRGHGERQPLVAEAVTGELAALGFEDADEVGRGGYGVVYRCTQVDLDRHVAVKVLGTELDEDHRARFLREQQAMGRLTGHPNIVDVLQAGTTAGGHPFIVMPYHPQDSLDTRIRRHGPLAVDEVLRLMVKMAGALETAHSLGIVHRDVKPANILLTDYGEPELTDFGIAQVAGGFRTATGTISGSPAYTAPEVLGGSAPGPFADVYGLGATAYCALTGHAAHERKPGEDVMAQFLRITGQPVPDLRQRGVPDDVAALVAAAMTRDPGGRPSAAALGDLARRAQRDHGHPVAEMALPSGDAPPRPADPGESTERAAPPPPRPDRTGNLPLELTSFLGRRSELAEAKNLLAHTRLVTFTGIGGVGKTRLALQVAAISRRSFPDGVWVVELGEIRDPALLPDMIAGALGLNQQSPRSLLDALTDHLADRKLLLVLDNCEHVVEAAARTAEKLLRACPEVRILATSREPLGIGGEAHLQVAPLGVPEAGGGPRAAARSDAVTLFVERAAAASPGFALTDDNAETIARICAQLDGLPLAIELAAARLQVLSPEQILDRLTDRYTFLSQSGRRVPSRQQTLRLCIDWGHDLCSPAEQQVWAQLSVFAAGFDLDAAEYVCRFHSDRDELLDVITALVDKSIVLRSAFGAEVRFRMLETLRDYGREKLQDGGEFVATCRRHRDWYRRLALDTEAAWIGPDQLARIARLGQEQPNLREALEFALTADGAVEADGTDTEAALQLSTALFGFWLARGLLGEGRHWLDRALAQGPARPTTLRAKALNRQITLVELVGDHAAAAVVVDRAREIGEQTRDPAALAFVEYVIGFHDLFDGDYAQACATLTGALDRFEAQSDLFEQVATLIPLGWACELNGNTDRSLAMYEKLLAICEAHGESTYRSHALWATAVAVWLQGDRPRAADLLVRGLRLARERDDPFAATPCLEALGWVAQGDRDARRAVVLMSAAETQGALIGMRGATFVLADLQVHHDAAEKAARRALGARAYESARREGAALSLGDAISYALRESAPAPAPAAAGPELTKRENEVADLIAEGLTNKAIAGRLVISLRTVQGHVEHILSKLGFGSRAQVAAWVHERRRDTP